MLIKRILLAMLFVLPLAACQQDGSAEQAGESLGQSAEQAGENLDQAADDTQDALSDAGDRMEDTGNDIVD